MGKTRDLSKEPPFGRLTAIAKAGLTPAKKQLWLCRCECGNEAIVVSSKLISGHTKS